MGVPNRSRSTEGVEGVMWERKLKKQQVEKYWRQVCG